MKLATLALTICLGSALLACGGGSDNGSGLGGGSPDANPSIDDAKPMPPVPPAAVTPTVPPPSCRPEEHYSWANASRAVGQKVPLLGPIFGGTHVAGEGTELYMGLPSSPAAT